MNCDAVGGDRERWRVVAPAHVRFQKIRCREGDVPVRTQGAADAAIRNMAGLGEPDGVRRGKSRQAECEAHHQQKATPHGDGLRQSRKGKNLTAFFRVTIKLLANFEARRVLNSYVTP